MAWPALGPCSPFNRDTARLPEGPAKPTPTPPPPPEIQDKAGARPSGQLLAAVTTCRLRARCPPAVTGSRSGACSCLGVWEPQASPLPYLGLLPTLRGSPSPTLGVSVCFSSATVGRRHLAPLGSPPWGRLPHPPTWHCCPLGCSPGQHTPPPQGVAPLGLPEPRRRSAGGGQCGLVGEPSARGGSESPDGRHGRLDPARAGARGGAYARLRTPASGTQLPGSLGPP